jgi:hypothetical protein
MRRIAYWQGYLLRWVGCMMDGENRAQRLGGFGWRAKRNPCATCPATAAPHYGLALT